jgi:hypothetical protein
MRSSLVITAAFLVLIHVRAGLAQPEGNLLPPPSSSSTAFVNVNVVPMDSESVLAGQTVVVQQGRITATGPVSSTSIPGGPTVIEGHGRYLMPGLADMHVHLEGREDFGDAPLFLAYGITTVMNLRGRPEILAWKKEIAAGKLLAPNFYTSGEFVNEPRVRTPKEVEDEIIRPSLFRSSQSLPALTIGATFFRTTRNAEQRDLPRIQRTARHEPKLSHAEFQPPASFAFRTQTITSTARMKRK